MRLLPLLIGLLTFMVPILAAPNNSRGTPGLAVLALILVMTGLIIAGPWLTMMSARLLAHWTSGASSLLAARRMADNPRAVFRAVSGLMLAVMVGSALAALVPAALASQDTARTGPLRDVLRVGFLVGDHGKPAPGTAPGLPPDSAAALLAKVTAIPGATPVPLYQPSQADRSAVAVTGPDDQADDVVLCADVRRVSALGTCPVGARSVLVDTSPLYTDNLRALNDYLPFIKPNSPVTTDDPAQQLLSDLLVKVNSPATLERVRTALSGYREDIDPYESPMTFGEVADARARSTRRSNAS